MSRTRRSMTFARRVERLLRGDSFDLVHAISPCRGADLYQPRGGTVAESIERNLALRRRRSAKALKRYTNRFNFKQRYSLALERDLLGDPDGPIVVAISRYVVRQLQRHYGLPEDRIRLVYNGVDPDPTPPEVRRGHRRAIRREFGIGDSDLFVLMVAHNFRLKGVRRWMEALSLMLAEGVTGVRSLVVGKGESPFWHRLAARLKLSDRLVFVGSSDRVSAFYYAADVLVHPTYYDPCSRVVLEAMSAGLPCITTVYDGAAEVIENGVGGLVLDDPWDVEGLADRVLRLREPAERQRIGEAALRAVENAGMARHTKEMLDLYHALARTGVRV